MEFIGDDIHIPEQEIYEISTFIDGSILTVYDSPWPGFTPDLMSILLVTATQAKGSVLIHQKMFESRLFFVDKLIDMGAQIILCDPHRATVIGINRQYQLRAIEMSSPDIRAGVALLIAAMSANGKSVIRNINQIDRGYQNIDQRLNAIGAQIRFFNLRNILNQKRLLFVRKTKLKLIFFKSQYGNSQKSGNDIHRTNAKSRIS